MTLNASLTGLRYESLKGGVSWGLNRFLRQNMQNLYLNTLLMHKLFWITNNNTVRDCDTVRYQVHNHFHRGHS